MARIAPSILAADFTRLGDELEKIEDGGAEVVHIDVMDGHFVPNISMGPFIVEAVRRVTSLFVDVHLMISSPEQYYNDFITAGADNITVHQEACSDLAQILADIKTAGAQCGVSVKPATPVSSLKSFADTIDMILIMSVEPGFGGQSFMPGSLQKISAARELLGPAKAVEVDGGISPANASAVIAAGADVLVAGTAVFKAEDPVAVIAAMKKG